MNHKRLSVSLVIPAYNEAFHLQRCLDSVAAQNRLPDEVIVVDNNSTDETALIATAFPFVTLVHEAQQGIVYARNAGFDAAKSDIIARIDADTVLPPDWTDYIRAYYANSAHQDSLWTSGGRFYNVGIPWLVNPAYNFLIFRFNQILMGHTTVWGSNMAFRRQQWKTLQSRVCLRTDIHEDLDLAIHAYREGFRICYDPNKPVVARLRGTTNSLSELWDYLQWWPRTLRVHGYKDWFVCWLFGAVMLYLASVVLKVEERLSGVFRTAASSD